MAGSKQPEQFRLPKDPKVEVEKSTMNDYLGFPRFVTGIKSLAGVLEVSSSTVNRWKASGLLDDATYQNGKYILFDVYGVLDILRVSNQKGRYNQSKYSHNRNEYNCSKSCACTRRADNCPGNGRMY